MGSRKSVNLPGVKICLPSLTEKDRSFIRMAVENDLDFIAHSFVRTKQDVIDVQTLLDEYNSTIKIIAKIENEEGVNNIDEILLYLILNVGFFWLLILSQNYLKLNLENLMNHFVYNGQYSFYIN